MGGRDNDKLWIGVCQISLVIRGAKSLKDRRQVIKSLTDRLKRSGAAVADLSIDGMHDKADISAVIAGSSAHEVGDRLDRIRSTVESAEITMDLEACDIASEVFEYGWIQDRPNQ